MPWKECHIMDERLRFVARLLEGEKMAPLCAEFGISRKTGYKIYDRYKDCGVTAFSDRSRRPHRQANRLPAPIEATIVRLKREYPGWGAPKIREKLRQQFTGPHLPAISTVHAVLDRQGLVQRRRRRRRATAGTTLSRPTDPNALWCADYKGEFMLGNRRYCYPLTITDFASRYLLTCEALSTTQEKFAFTVFERTFKTFGLPRVIRTDNGVLERHRRDEVGVGSPGYPRGERAGRGKEGAGLPPGYGARGQRVRGVRRSRHQRHFSASVADQRALFNGLRLMKLNQHPERDACEAVVQFEQLRVWHDDERHRAYAYAALV